MPTIITFVKKLLNHKRAKPPMIDAKYIIPRHAHALSKTEIDPNALTVVNKLTRAGFQAYIVGGGVRDLLLRLAPKDFDVATNATPHQIRGLFKNARIIGRRFKLAHILFYKDIIEVATFRGQAPHPKKETQKTNDQGMIVRDNSYGTLEQDIWRRDFTINALYYDVKSATIIDYSGGFEDLKKKTLKIIGEPALRYQEDPVRMLRAIRFSAKLGFQIEEQTAAAIYTMGHLLLPVSNSRLFDEIIKLYHSGQALTAQTLLSKFKLFQLLFPQLAQIAKKNTNVQQLIHHALTSTDQRIQAGKPVTPAFLFAALLWFPMRHQASILENTLAPLEALEHAMTAVILEQSKITMIPKRYAQVIREIWLLQFRFSKREGTKPFQLLEHPRFRAAYDLLLLRSKADDEQESLVTWWETFQFASTTEQQKMIKEVS